MSEADTTAYIFGGTNTERQRLVVQAQELEHQARWLLEHIGIQPGWRVIDVGCGPIGILHLLSEHVGPQGGVTGLEFVPRFAEMAVNEIARRGLTNVKVVQADALSSGLQRNAFDFAHERLVMINVPAPQAILSEMIALVRPGGTLAVEEVDDASWLCHPAHPSWDILVETYHSAFRASGGNVFFGRCLPEMLRAAGLEDVQWKVHVDTVPPGAYRRKHLLSLLDSLQHKVISLGLLTDKLFAAHKEALEVHLDDPDTILIDKLLVQAWGRKPMQGSRKPTTMRTGRDGSPGREIVRAADGIPRDR
jgi:SAM-dependent methyltransferase